MNAHRNRSIILWLAALAILWGVLAPALAAGSAVNPAHPDQAWFELCASGSGARLEAPGPGAHNAAGDKVVHTGMHCPACVAQCGATIGAHPPGGPVLPGGARERLVRADGPGLPCAAAPRGVHHSRAPPPAA